MPHVTSSAETSSHLNHEQFVVVPEIWMDECCGQVGLLHTLLRVLSGMDLPGEAHGLVADALNCCDNLQELLNSVPLADSHSGSLPPATSEINHSFDVETPFQPELAGDNFPVFAMEEDDQVPSFGEDRIFAEDDQEPSVRLHEFHQQALGDLQEIELLSIGRDWFRVARLASGLKSAAAHVSAYRIVADAAALEAAAHAGRHHDIDLALDALRADLRACAREINDSLVTV